MRFDPRPLPSWGVALLMAAGLCRLRVTMAPWPPASAGGARGRGPRAGVRGETGEGESEERGREGEAGEG